MSDSKYKKLRKKVKEDKGIDLGKLKSHDPYILEKLLENDNGKRDVFLDAYLYRTSKYLGKRIFGLEEHNRKVSSTDVLSEIEKEELIREFTNKYLKEDEEESDLYLDSLKRNAERLVSIYESGDIDLIEEYITEVQMRKDTIILDYRNKIMAAKMDSIMKLNLCLFSAVGAAHLSGENGLLKILEAKGYKVSPVKADFTGKSEEYQEKFKNKKGVFYEEITEGFSIVFPGSPAVSEIKQSSQKMYFYQEVGTSLYYMFMTVNAVDINMDKHKMMEEMFKNMNARMGIKNGESEEIVFKGLEGRESKIATDILNGYIRVLLNKNKLYLMMAAGSRDDVESNQPFIDQFLSSFEYFDIEKDVVYWENVEDKAYAIQFEMPETYTSFPFTIKNPSDLTGEPFFLSLYSSVDHNANCSYLVRSNDFPVGYCSDDDSYLFEELGDIIIEEYKATVDKRIDTTFEGYPANLIYFDFDQGGKGELLSCIRGNRCYMFLKQASPTSTQDVNYLSFFNKIKFTDLNPVKQETYYTSLSGLGIPFPSDKKEQSFYYYDASIDTITTVSGLDDSTGTVFTLHEKKYKDFYQIENFDSLAAIWKKDLDLDSVVYFKVDTVKGKPRAIIKSIYDKTSYLGYHIMQTSNLVLNQLSLFYAKELDTSQTYFEPFSSFDFSNTSDSVSFYESKFERLLVCLSGEDSIQQHNAYEALSYTNLKQEDLQLLYSVIRDSLINEDSSWYIHPKAKLVSQFVNVNDSSTIGYLSDLFAKDTIEDVRNAILNTLIDIDTDSSYLKFFELAQNYKSNYYQLWSFMSSFREDMDKAKRYEAHWKTSGDSELLFYCLINCTSSWIDEDSLNLDWLNQYASTFQKGYSNFFEHIIVEDNDYQKKGLFEGLAKIMHTLYQPVDYVTLFNQLKGFPVYYKKEGIIGLLKAKEKVSKSTIGNLLKDPYSGYGFALSLDKAGFSRILHEHVNQVSLVKMVINDELTMDDDNGYEKIKLLEKYEVIKEGVVSHYYIMKYKYSWSEHWQVAIVGSQPVNGELNLNPDLRSIYDFGDYDKATWEQTFEEIKNFIKEQ